MRNIHTGNGIRESHVYFDVCSTCTLVIYVWLLSAYPIVPGRAFAGIVLTSTLIVGMSRLTTEEKWAIVLHMKNTQSAYATSKMIGCCVKTVKRWWQCYLGTGGVNLKRSSGRKSYLSGAAAERALHMLTDKQHCNSAAIVAQQLKQEGLTTHVLSRSTVIRAAKRIATAGGHGELVVKRGKPKKVLTASTKRKRMEFARRYKGRCWDDVMFTDRKRFLFAYPGSKVAHTRWVLKKPGAEEGDSVYQPNHPYSVNIYLGLTKFGMTAVHKVSGTSKQASVFRNKRGKQAKNITQGEYEDVLLTTLLPSGQKLFSQVGLSHWYLQQDNDPSHAKVASVLCKFNKQRRGTSTKVSLLEAWPPNSPDLNLIENVWSWLQSRVNAEGCHTFEEFSKAIDKAITHVPQGMRVKLYNSMKKRLDAVLQKGGGPCGY